MNHESGTSMRADEAAGWSSALRRRPTKARAMVRHCSAKESRLAETRIGAPSQVPICEYALAGRVTAATTAPVGFTQVDSAPSGPRTRATKRLPASIESVTRRPMSAPAAMSAGP